MSDLSKSERALGQLLVNLAREGNGLDVSVDDDVEIDWSDWSIEEVDMGVTNNSDNEPYIEVHFTQQSSQSERVARATHWQPAEYTNHDVELIGTVRLFPVREYLGVCEGEIMQEGGRPSPEPSYEPYDERL